MKKIILGLGLSLVLSSQAFSVCYCFYSQGTGEGQVPSNVEQLMQSVAQEQANIMKKYSTEIMPLVDEIAKLTEEKERLIKSIKEVEKHSLLTNKEAVFLMKQEASLMDNAIEIEGVE